MEPVSMESLRSQSPFDLCFLELSKEELTGFGAMHSRLRGLLRPGGRMVAFCQLRGTERVSERDFALISDGLPARDTGELRFGGGLLTYWLQRLWEGARAKAESGRTWDLARLALIAGLVGPLALLANQRAHNRQPGRFPGHCTSLLLVVTIN